MCEEDHEEANRDCPLWERDIIEMIRPDGRTHVWIIMEDLPYFLEKGFLVLEQPRMYYAFNPMAIYGGGSNDLAQDKEMKEKSPTQNNPSVGEQWGSTLSGEWIDDVNTVWINKAVNQFEWALKNNLTKWNGGTAVPPRVNNVYQVSTPSELRYALQTLGETVSKDQAVISIELTEDINMNGNTYAWNPVIRQNRNCKIELNGKGHTIYNLGIFTGKTQKVCVFVDCQGNGSVFKNITFSNAKLVGYAADQSLSQSQGARERSASLFGRDSRRWNVFQSKIP